MNQKGQSVGNIRKRSQPGRRRKPKRYRKQRQSATDLKNPKNTKRENEPANRPQRRKNPLTKTNFGWKLGKKFRIDRKTTVGIQTRTKWGPRIIGKSKKKATTDGIPGDGKNRGKDTTPAGIQQKRTPPETAPKEGVRAKH